jgi:hypothetical protein
MVHGLVLIRRASIYLRGRFIGVRPAQIAEEKAEPTGPMAPDGHLGIGNLRAANED